MKVIRCNKKKKSFFNYKAAWDTLHLPGRANHLQAYSAAVVSADNIAINVTPLVISPTQRKTPQVTQIPKIWAK